MAKTLNLRISSQRSAAELRQTLAFGPKSHAKDILGNLGSGLDAGNKIECQMMNDDAVAASATVTFSAAATANDTVIINGVTFTAKASGATGNQFNVGASATASALALSNAINASSTDLISGVVKGSPAVGVVTVSARQAGLIGNYMTIAEGVDSGSVISVSAARLSGGTEDTAAFVNMKNAENI